MLYATGLTALAANSEPNNDVCMDGVLVPNLAESVTVEFRTTTGMVYRVPVEFAGTTGQLPGLDQIVIVLTPELLGAGVVDLTLIVNGQLSNKPTFVIL
jgi:uncharacterized protein (TIGR03437 family)